MRNKFNVSIALFVLVMFLISTTTAYAASGSDSSTSVAVAAKDVTELEATIQSELAKKPEVITILFTAKAPKDATSYLQGVKDAIQHAQSSLNEELYWNMKSLSYKMKGSIGNLKITLEPSYLTTNEQDQFVNEEVDRILDKILTSKMTPFEKEKAIHDYVVSHTSYEDLGEIGHTAYSALYNNKAVCQGYAILTNMLLGKAGIESHLVVGYINDDPDQSHMWNEVKIDDNWYMLDTVFDDPTPDHPGVQSTDYFNVTNEALSAMGHTWEVNDYPVADTVYHK
ncbi:hypothetical protein A8709_01135 [Paenibacillus pectinilyticus]|uniref:Transglutaminase-like domain-containing protein n=1 Tax=Paenibacillus pectinilyticus TaxID=512399 RepID=A0A1C0ZYQ3_9BACL|nr:transglutaminase domain-containing protein [Paenibacillus pectinilyticus]OCT13260.1 hypothetical protein A8709_01135 [Paenibacillus pectinilyticus]